MLPKLSLITVCYNSENTIEDTLRSVSAQTYPSIEYIVIDGQSRDSTNSLVSGFSSIVNKHVIEPDMGIYDAMNKGIKIATGEVIGFLNSDDFLLRPDSLSKLMLPFAEESLDIVYGDLFYVNSKNLNKIERDWSSGQYSRNKLNFGWMPAHPAFYARKELFERWGGFDLQFKIAADYDLMTRFLRNSRESRIRYLPEKVVAMRSGGTSNQQGLKTILLAAQECIKSGHNNDLSFPELSAILKILRKIGQIAIRPRFNALKF